MSVGASEDVAQLYRTMYSRISDGELTWEGGHEHKRGRADIAQALRALLSER